MESIPLLPPSAPPNTDGIRILTAEEIKTVEHVFKEKGSELPDPSVSTFVGSVQGGRVVGFIVLQLRLHAEPAYIEPGHSSIFQSLVRVAEETIIRRCGSAWVYLFAPAGRIAQLAHEMGMQTEPFVIMSKFVAPEPLAKSAMDLGVLPLDETVEGAVQ